MADDGGHVLDAGFLGCKRDLSFHHSFGLAQDGFQAAGVVIVCQALDDQLGLAAGHPITGALDPRDQLAQPQFGRVELHRGAFRGQVDRRGLHAVQLFQVALYRGDAICAGHPGDGEGELPGLSHRPLDGQPGDRVIDLAEQLLDGLFVGRGFEDDFDGLASRIRLNGLDTGQVDQLGLDGVDTVAARDIGYRILYSGHGVTPGKKYGPLDSNRAG